MDENLERDEENEGDVANEAVTVGKLITPPVKPIYIGTVFIPWLHYNHIMSMWVNKDEKPSIEMMNQRRAMRGLLPLKRECEKCLSPDHYTSECKEIFCYLCANIGHLHKECAIKKLCQICGKDGHREIYCKSTNAVRLRMTCRGCKRKGHTMLGCKIMANRKNIRLSMK